MEVLCECRCCLARGVHKDLQSYCFWSNKKENYNDILKECFNIMLSSEHYSNGICDTCIQSLRSSLKFKEQVLRSEEELMTRVKECANDEKLFNVKLEPKQDSGEDSDDYFLADAVRELPVNGIKTEEKGILKANHDPKKSKLNNSLKKSNKSERSWRNEKIRDLVSRVASMNSSDLADMKPKKDIKKRKLTLEPISKINLVWTRTTQDKMKHRENLQTILNYSNATPFKNKSLLGFICGYCEAAYPDPSDLRQHTVTDHKKERLDFKSTFDMTEYNVKLDIVDLICTLCDNQMDNLNTLKDHLVKIHNKTIYSDIKDHILQFKLKKGDVFDCAMCTSTYETFKMLKQHMNKHYSNYVCGKCGTAFATKRSLNAHRTTHQEGSFKCDHCDKVFASRSKKCYHEKMKHLGARNISNCPYCDEPFRSYYQRNQHLVKVHNNEAQYKCNVCSKSYILKSLLMYHIKKNHLMEKNCQCNECGYRFFSKKSLKAHMVKHTGERIYACEVCNKSYARKYTLREHMRIHNNDRRFKCEVCSSTFVQKCSLKSHLLSNHGISMAACDITSSKI